MKRIVFIISVLLLLCSCSNEEEVEQSVMEPEYDAFECIVGQKFFASCKAEGKDYAISLDHPDIISWEPTKNKGVIRIKALNIGKASIKITVGNDSVVAVIDVSVRYFDSKEIWETGEAPQDVKNKVVVTAEDSSVKQRIEKELWEGVNNMRGTTYAFDGDTKKFTMNVNGQQHEGVYRCNGDSLVLNYEGMTENYAFKMVGGLTIYILTADRTEEFRGLYPNAGISSVIVERVWRDIYRESRPRFGLII